jgi:tRNA-dihydrouridine synthase B
MNKQIIKNNISFGRLSVPQLMAAPLDGVTDSPLRQLIREFSPNELIMTEMRHVAHVANDKKDRTLNYNDIEHPIAFQFSGNKIDFIDYAVERVIEKKFDMINFNCGCPSRSVVQSGSGSALMADPPRLKILLDHFYRCINGRIPFTVKIRSGFKESPNAVEIAQIAQDSGVDGMMIHPRMQSGGFSSMLDFDLVRKVKNAVSIPVIFSGNINSFSRLQKTHNLTGVDGFMIGRALWGAPWKMREIAEHAKGNDFLMETQTIISYAIKHFHLSMMYYGKNGFNVFKKQLPLYIRNVKNASEWRMKLLRSQSDDEMRKNLEQVYVENGGN